MLRDIDGFTGNDFMNIAPEDEGLQIRAVQTNKYTVHISLIERKDSNEKELRRELRRHDY